MSKSNTKHFVTSGGRYIGGFGDGAKPPAGSIEVAKAPSDGSDTWDGSEWVVDSVQKEKKDKTELVLSETDALFDILLDHLAGAPLPEDFAPRVAARKSAKLEV